MNQYKHVFLGSGSSELRRSGILESMLGVQIAKVPMYWLSYQYDQICTMKIVS